MNKNVKKWPVFVKTSNFESKNCISMRNFDQQQTFQLKTIINRANERVSLLQIPKILFCLFNTAAKTKLMKSCIIFTEVLERDID